MRLAKCWPEGPLVLGKDAIVSQVVARLIPWVDTFGPCTTLGVIHREKLVGGFVLHNYRPQYKSIEMSAGFVPGYIPRPELYRSLSAYVFLQLGCNRACALTPKHHRKARKFLEWSGFKLEGCARRGFGRDDAMIYGMLKKECPWLKKEQKDNGIVTSRPAAAA